MNEKATTQTTQTWVDKYKAPPQGTREYVSWLVSTGWTIDTDTGDVVLLKRGDPVNHILHFLLGFITFGLWWVTVWPLMAIFGGVEQKTVRIAPTA